MTPVYRPSWRPRALGGGGISLAVHALLIGMWQLARPLPAPDDALPRRSQFLRLLPALAPVPERRETAPPPAPRGPSAARAVPAQQPAAHGPAPAAPAVEEIVDPAQAQAQAPAAPASAAEMLRNARAAVGGIDRALRRENQVRGIEAPVETAQMKLQRNITRAAQLAPNKWYQAPKTEAIIDPGGYGRRRYRVVGAAGTYCVTYESNHAPDGIDSMSRGLTPKFTSCEEAEQPATNQKWNEAPPPARHPLLRN